MYCALAFVVAGLAFSAASVLADLARRSNRDVDVVGLQNAAQVGFVRGAGPEPLDRRLLVPERPQERVRELAGVERLLGQRGYGFFDLDGVHSIPRRLLAPTETEASPGAFSCY